MQNSYSIPFAVMRRSVAVLVTTLLVSMGVPNVQSQGKSPIRTSSEINITPTITEIGLNELGQLVASGEVTAVIRGRTTTAPFTDVPVNLSLPGGDTQTGCPILNLQLGPIDLNLLGLVVETSQICLSITAYESGGLLGDLLCDVANLLDGGILGDVLANLTEAQLGALLDLLNEALAAVSGNVAGQPSALLTGVTPAQAPNSCDILNLTLAPIDLTLLGLNVHLDNCTDGAITVDVTGQRGQLLGDLLCGLLGGIDLGSTLQDIVDQLLGLPALNKP